MALTWSGFLESDEEEGKSMATTGTPPQAAQTASHTQVDAAFQDLQRRLNAAIAEVEQGRAREAALLRRALKSEEAEEAFASQMADLEAEAFTLITQANKRLPSAAAGRMKPVTCSPMSVLVEELTIRLQVAVEDVAAWARRCQDLEKEVEEGRVRDAAFWRRAETDETAEDALASEMTELKAEAFAHITEKLLLDKQCNGETKPIKRSQVEEVERRRLAEAGEALEVVRAKLLQAEEKNRQLEMRVVQLVLEGEKEVTLKSGDKVLSLSLEDLEGVKLKLWKPFSLALTSC